MRTVPQTKKSVPAATIPIATLLRVPYPSTVLSTTAVQAFLLGTVSPMSEVLQGDFDLRVPVVTAVVDSLSKLSPIDVAVELVVSGEPCLSTMLPTAGVASGRCDIQDCSPPTVTSPSSCVARNWVSRDAIHDSLK